MTTTPQVLRYHTTEYLSRAHGDEFVVVVDSLGRRWNPLLHPRDSKGRFIRTFSFVTFDLPGGGTASGRVAGIDRDGSLLVKVQGTTPGADPRIAENGYVKVPHDEVEVRTVKAQLSGRGAAGRLDKQENDSVNTGIKNLRNLGLNEQADKLVEAQRLAMSNPKAPDAAAAKQRSIDLFREVGEELGDERGKGFKEGDDYDEVKDQMTSEEKARLQTLDRVMGTTFTARHSLGDRSFDDIEGSQGKVKAKYGQVRVEAAENEMEKDYAEDAPVWDITSGSIVEGQMEQPQKAEVRDTAAEPATTEGLPEFWRSAYQKNRSGVDRLTGSQQSQQVAPGDRHHEDKNGARIRVGQVVHVDKTKSRAEYDGIVSRIYTDKNNKKHVYGRDFDPDGSKGYMERFGTPYKDWSVDGKSVEIASDDQQSTLFQALALEGQDAASKSLVKSFTEEYIATMQRRYATPGALKISGVAPGFFDVVPIHLRQKKDANGEIMRIGDAVQGPNGEDGYVSYLEPNANTTKVYWRNGKSSRLTSNKLKRLHGPTSEVFPDESAPNTNNYVPTREEAAAIADEKGADSVAQVIRDGGDAQAIQAAMVTNVEFQGQVDDVDALYNKRDQTRAAGQEPSAEEQAELDKWDRMFMASAGYFREPDDPEPEPPVAPTPDPEMAGEAPQNPDNPTEKITEGGTSVREEDGNVIVDDNTEDPIPVDDQEAIDQRVAEVEAEKGPEAPAEEAPPPQALAEKMLSDMGRLVEEAKQTPQVDSTQRAGLDQMMSRMADAVKKKDGDAFVRGLQGLTNLVNRQSNANLHQTRLRAVLNGRATNGVPMADFLQARLDAGDDIFNAPTPVVRPDRPEGRPDETPEGVDPQVDKTDNVMSEALLMDDGSTLVMRGDEPIDEGFYVVDPTTVTEYDAEPTTQDIIEFLNETQGSDYDGISVWYDESDGRFRMARVGIFDDEQQASDAAANSESNQYVSIADGSVMNVALGGDPNMPTEAIEDPRSEERAVRTAGTGSASASTTAKQKNLLDHVGGLDEARGTDVGRITEAVKNGEEISGADASRLADYVDGLGVEQFEKPADKGLASQLAHKLARATGEEGPRGYTSQSTALSRGSSVGISLTAQSQNDEIRSLVDRAKDDVKNGDMRAAAAKFRDAADAFDALGPGGVQVPAERAREHAARLDAMGGVTAPAVEGVPEAVPAPQQGEAPTVEQALANAGVPETVPITRQSLTNPDTERTREVDPVQFSALAAQGKDSLTQRWDNSAEPTVTQGETLETLKSDAWDSVQEEWGGLTADAHEAQIVSPTEGYAMTVRPPGMETVSTPIGGSQDDFNTAMDQAAERYGGPDGPLAMEGAHLGVFRNEDTGNIEIDPVLVVDDVEDVERIGAYTGAVGGAYNFADGLGYWPPYVGEGEAGGGEGPEAEPGAVARPGEGEGEAPPGVGEAEEGPGAPGAAALEVGTTPTETLENLFDRIGLPEEYGTEHQGRMLGEARSLLTEGLTDDAADRVRTAANAAPEGSDEKRLMLEAADALTGLPEGDTGPLTPGGGGSEEAEVGSVPWVQSILWNADTAVQSERLAEGDNGPQGWTETVDEANSMVRTIQDKVAAEGVYPELADDLRELADYMDGNWVLTDPSDYTDELRTTADALGGPGTAIPEGGTPEGEAVVRSMASSASREGAPLDLQGVRSPSETGPTAGSEEVETDAGHPEPASASV